MTPPVSLAALLTANRNHADLVAFTPEEQYSFGQFRADIAYNTEAIKDRRSSRVILAAKSSYWAAVGLFASLYAGTDLIFPPNLQSGTLQRYIANTTDLLLVDEAVDGGVLLEAAPSVNLRTVPWPLLDLDAEKLHFLTSGSSGHPKTIKKTLRQLDIEIALLEKLWGGMIGEASVYATVPHQHIFGLTFKLLWPLAANRPFSIPLYDIWEELLAAVRAPFLLVASPAHLSRISGLPPLPTHRQPKLILAGGAPLSYEAAQNVRDIFGQLPQELYGSTETGVIAERRQALPNTVWTPLPGIHITPQADGQLKITSPYAHEKDSLLPDRVEMGCNGFLLLGRADRIVKIEGKRVSLPELEASMRNLPWFSAAAAATAGEKLGAVVVLNDAGARERHMRGDFVFRQMIMAALRSVYDAAAVPKKWRYVDKLPQDGMGKIKAADITAILEGPQAEPLND